MLVIEPPAARFEAEDTAPVRGEHLLERVSALENRLSRLTDKLQQTLDLMLKQAQNSYFDHTLIEALIATLSEAGAIEAEGLRKLWREQCRRDTEQQDEKTRRLALRRKIIASYSGTERSGFEQLVGEGLDLLEAQETLRGISRLELAADLSTDNTPLLSFLGQHFFAASRMTEARSYLARAFQSAPDDVGLCLLLGIACGEEGETERARALLGQLVGQGRESFAAHYGLGRLLAADERWTEALREFKRALALRPSAEAHYVLGSAYYMLGRDRLAAQHLRRAVKLDEGYAAALYTLGLVYLRAGERERARLAFKSAHAASRSEPDAPYRAASRRVLRAGAAPDVPPLFDSLRQARGHLFTGADKRLAEMVKDDALKAMLSAGKQ
jgi:tetratricopeptide (TPR) repeat protein